MPTTPLPSIDSLLNDNQIDKTSDQLFYSLLNNQSELIDQIFKSNSKVIDYFKDNQKVLMRLIEFITILSEDISDQNRSVKFPFASSAIFDTKHPAIISQFFVSQSMNGGSIQQKKIQGNSIIKPNSGDQDEQSNEGEEENQTSDESQQDQSITQASQNTDENSKIDERVIPSVAPKECSLEQLSTKKQENALPLKERPFQLPLLNQLFQFIIKKGDINEVLAGYWSKLVNILFDMHSQELVEYIYLSKGVVDGLVHHSQNQSISLIIQRLLTIEQNKLTDAQTYHFHKFGQHSILLVNKLINQLNCKNNIEYQMNISTIVEEIINNFYVLINGRQLFDHITSSQSISIIFNGFFSDINDTKSEDPNDQEDNLENNIRRRVAFGNLINSLAKHYVQNSDSLISGYDEGSEYDCILSQYEESPFILQLNDSWGDIEETLKIGNIKCQVVGLYRMKMVEITSQVIRIQFPSIIRGIKEYQIFKLLLDLFFIFQWNNILHQIVLNVIKQILKKQNNKQNRDYSCHLIKEIHIQDIITNHVNKDAYYFFQPSNKNKSTTKGYLGYAIQIADTLEGLFQQETKRQKEKEAGESQKKEGNLSVENEQVKSNQSIILTSWRNLDWSDFLVNIVDVHKEKGSKDLGQFSDFISGKSGKNSNSLSSIFSTDTVKDNNNNKDNSAQSGDANINNEDYSQSSQKIQYQNPIIKNVEPIPDFAAKDSQIQPQIFFQEQDQIEGSRVDERTLNPNQRAYQRENVKLVQMNSKKLDDDHDEDNQEMSPSHSSPKINNISQQQQNKNNNIKRNLQMNPLDTLIEGVKSPVIMERDSGARYSLPLHPHSPISQKSSLADRFGLKQQRNSLPNMIAQNAQYNNNMIDFQKQFQPSQQQQFPSILSNLDPEPSFSPSNQFLSDTQPLENSKIQNYNSQEEEFSGANFNQNGKTLQYNSYYEKESQLLNDKLVNCKEYNQFINKIKDFKKGFKILNSNNIQLILENQKNSMKNNSRNNDEDDDDEEDNGNNSKLNLLEIPEKSALELEEGLSLLEDQKLRQQQELKMQYENEFKMIERQTRWSEQNKGNSDNFNNRMESKIEQRVNQLYLINISICQQQNKLVQKFLVDAKTLNDKLKQQQRIIQQKQQHLSSLQNREVAIKQFQLPQPQLQLSEQQQASSKQQQQEIQELSEQDKQSQQQEDIQQLPQQQLKEVENSEQLQIQQEQKQKQKMSLQIATASSSQQQQSKLEESSNNQDGDTSPCFGFEKKPKLFVPPINNINNNNTTTTKDSIPISINEPPQLLTKISTGRKNSFQRMPSESSADRAQNEDPYDFKASSSSRDKSPVPNLTSSFMTDSYSSQQSAHKLRQPHKPNLDHSPNITTHQTYLSSLTSTITPITQGIPRLHEYEPFKPEQNNSGLNNKVYGIRSQISDQENEQEYESIYSPFQNYESMLDQIHSQINQQIQYLPSVEIKQPLPSISSTPFSESSSIYQNKPDLGVGSGAIRSDLIFSQHQPSVSNPIIMNQYSYKQQISPNETAFASLNQTPPTTHPFQNLFKANEQDSSQIPLRNSLVLQQSLPVRANRKLSNSDIISKEQVSPTFSYQPIQPIQEAFTNNYNYQFQPPVISQQHSYPLQTSSNPSKQSVPLSELYKLPKGAQNHQAQPLLNREVQDLIQKYITQGKQQDKVEFNSPNSYNQQSSQQLYQQPIYLADKYSPFTAVPQEIQNQNQLASSEQPFNLQSLQKPKQQQYQPPGQIQEYLFNGK